MTPNHPTFRSVRPTLWGLSAAQLHEHFWASRGVQVVRRGEQEPLPPGAEQYLLVDREDLVLFRVRPLVELLSWVRPDLLYLRLRTGDASVYRERVVSDGSGNFVAIRRSYGGVGSGLVRVALTGDPALAELWRSQPDASSAWRALRAATRARRREVRRLNGYAFDMSDDASVSRFVRELVRQWPSPAATVPNVRRAAPSVWAHAGARVMDGVRFVGPVWVGAGRTLDTGNVVGPAALWDDPLARPLSRAVAWDAIEPSPSDQARAAAVAARPERLLKRPFDLAFSTLAVLATLPLWAAVMAAIWLEDGKPIFYVQRRETRGGRQFGCVKFRSMRKDADGQRQALAGKNGADGPQFYIENDPRLTRVGRVIRRLNLDELPQFLNVLAGHMSVVGPRPSPRAENQYCPPWREARLSVRAGITGLWQVSRTRRKGLDFQEWIKYDLEYVEHESWKLDLAIIWRTLWLLVAAVFR